MAARTSLASRAKPAVPTSLLSSIDIFRSLPAPELAELQHKVRHRSFRKGEILFHHGDAATTLYVLVRGRVRITATIEGGAELTLAILRPGDWFGELALLQDGERSATAVALEATEALTLHHADFLQVLRTSFDAVLALLRVLAARLAATNEHVVASCYLDVPARLAWKLLELAESDGVARDGGVRIELNLTQQALAAMVGASRERTGRALNEFRDRGLLRFEDRRIVLLRPDLLERYR